MSRTTGLASIFSCLSLTQLALSANIGSWSAPIQFPLVPVAAAVSSFTGNIVVWSAFANNAFQVDHLGQTKTAIFDPVSGNITQYTVTQTNHDMFCPGISIDASGRIIVTGGDTAKKTSILETSSDDEDWVAGPEMNIPRGYQSSCTLSDGRVFTIGGSWSGGRGGKNGEVYDPDSNMWTPLPNARVRNMLTADAGGIRRADNHGWLFAWHNGFVLQAGPSKCMNWYNTTGLGSVRSAGNRNIDNDAMNGNAVMFNIGKILSVGGSPSYENSTASSSAFVITVNNVNQPPIVEQIGNMGNPRAFASAVVLPTGHVFINGGQSYAVPFSDANSIMVPELWDPQTNNFTSMAPNAIPRNYHSVAVLMPDGRVFTGGGGLCGNSCSTNHFDGEFFSPPYLFEDDGVTLATRPNITSVSSEEVDLGAVISVQTDSQIVSFVMIRYGSNTHTVNTDQRRIPLESAWVEQNVYNVTLPVRAGIAIPGYWMLFAINDGGVPSVAARIKIIL